MENFAAILIQKKKFYKTDNLTRISIAVTFSAVPVGITLVYPSVTILSGMNMSNSRDTPTDLLNKEKMKQTLNANNNVATKKRSLLSNNTFPNPKKRQKTSETLTPPTTPSLDEVKKKEKTTATSRIPAWGKQLIDKFTHLEEVLEVILREYGSDLEEGEELDLGDEESQLY